MKDLDEIFAKMDECEYYYLPITSISTRKFGTELVMTVQNEKGIECTIHCRNCIHVKIQNWMFDKSNLHPLRDCTYAQLPYPMTGNNYRIWYWDHCGRRFLWCKFYLCHGQVDVACEDIEFSFAQKAEACRAERGTDDADA